jgi:hypothetical protein
VVFALTDKIDDIFAVCIGGSWLVAFIWIGRSPKAKDLTVVTRLLVLFIVGALLAYLATSGSTWAMTAYKEAKAPKPVSAESEQNEAWNNLKGETHLPPSGNPIDSIVTLTNEGKIDVIIDQLRCRHNFAVYEKSMIFEKSTLWFTSKGFPKRLQSGGDADSAACLSQLYRITPLVCADITFQSDYTIAAQPNVPKSKQFRFVYDKVHGWYKVPNEEASSRCETGETALPDTSKYKILTACAQGCDYLHLQDALNAAKCGTIIYFDKNETRPPTYSLHAGANMACTTERQMILHASSNPLEDAKLEKLD